MNYSYVQAEINRIEILIRNRYQSFSYDDKILINTSISNLLELLKKPRTRSRSFSPDLYYTKRDGSGG
jgi:hypothetical protein